MNRSRILLVLTTMLAGTLALSACGTNSNGASGNGAPSTTSSSPAPSGGTSAGGTSADPAAPASDGCATGHLSGAGSSFQGPMQDTWIAGYSKQCPGVQINYQSVGSGQGIATFGAGQIDFAGSDVPMKASEQTAADKRCHSRAIHIPVTAGGVAVTWNLPGVTALRFSPVTLAKIFDGKITKWDDPAIAADNPAAKLPGLPITVVYRSDASGTNAVFTSYLAATAGSAWPLGSGKTVSWPVGQGAAQNEGVSAAVAQTPGAITYTEQAFAEQHHLPTAQMRNGSGQYVTLSAGTVSQALASARVEPAAPGDLTTAVDYRPTAGYPISTVTYVIACSTYPAGSTVAPLLKSYLTYATTTGQQSAGSLGFAPLPAALRDQIASSIAGIR